MHYYLKFIINLFSYFLTFYFFNLLLSYISHIYSCCIFSAFTLVLFTLLFAFIFSLIFAPLMLYCLIIHTSSIAGYTFRIENLVQKSKHHHLSIIILYRVSQHIYMYSYINLADKSFVGNFTPRCEELS